MPRVRAYDWSRCPRSNADNYICLDLDVDLEIGWEWYQDQVQDNLYRASLQFYTQQSAEIHPEFNYPRALYVENTYTLTEF